ncbi:RagB/SusD family nutrient uptake outer membrane protein [Echinicola marina]|uniref:RagB/SusD family nutrient uptake outer membrane protein n=1 Tax=Echinicola marina TaxID=2859768 RepID=UPI001CF67A18|nr:RagB/SusD family nutrient uptake outer membrane protein [Echinicola marina]UCS91653.1 RagB/SusD family nutrient uptake outer membrane protein [Echinicola marina]
MSTFFVGCEDYLEKPPSIDVTDQTIFQNIRNAETFLWEVYASSIPFGWATQDWDAELNYLSGVTAGQLAAACDEGDIADSWPGPNIFNKGEVTPVKNPEDNFLGHYKAIRKSNIFIERIEGVPDGTTEYKLQLKAEARFLRALQYFELIKRYGGVPLVKRKLNNEDELNINRSSLKECVDFVLAECDEIVPDLMSSAEGVLAGRITKGAAHALKSRMALYAASPLFNNNSPYLEGKNSELWWYGNYSGERWDVAAAAANDVLKWAESVGVRLITEYGPDVNYTYASTEPDNPEIILSSKFYPNMDLWREMYFQFTRPSGFRGSWYGVSVPLNFIKYFQTNEGEYLDWPQSGEDLDAMYTQLEPRFNQCILVNGTYWNDDEGWVQIWTNPDGSKSKHARKNNGGQWLRKFIPDEMTAVNKVTNMEWPVYRLAEFYLNYAEAMNEAYGPNNSHTYGLTAIDAVNMIRERSGLPQLSPNISHEEMRTAIIRERAIELYAEEHRFWDVKRWKIAENEGVMKGDFYGLMIRPIVDSEKFSFEQYVFEERFFSNKDYLYPFPSSEIFKGYLQQNPGW